MSWTGLRTASLLLACIGMLLATAPTWAGDTQYSATVPVADRSNAARGTAVREALGEVLIRVSGDPAVLQRAGSAALLARANRYLQQYQYEGGEAGSSLALQAGFDGAALEADMRQQGLSVGGRASTSFTGQLASQLTLRVDGVTGLGDYARIDQYLNGLPLSNVVLVAAQAQHLDYRVDVPGGAVGLEQALVPGGILERLPTTDGSGVQSYRLRP